MINSKEWRKIANSKGLTTIIDFFNNKTVRLIKKNYGNPDYIVASSVFTHMSDPNKLRLNECSKYFDAKFVSPTDKEVKSDSFDIVFDTVGLEVSRQQAISVVKPGGSIIHIGLTQPAGEFNFRKATLQEITFIGTYCYTNQDFSDTIQILAKKDKAIN